MKRDVGIRMLYALLCKAEVNEPVCMDPTEALYNKNSYFYIGKQEINLIDCKVYQILSNRQRT